MNGVPIWGGEPRRLDHALKESKEVECRPISRMRRKLSHQARKTQQGRLELIRRTVEGAAKEFVCNQRG